ncbi:uncharacterized protein LOC122505874 [Leptopilina heterotoma]|uniref:uncharacterized protein LOC122505874 n=1 Tax=Leptopilina heterotoma TaxID=63436 RepID=UPI001CA91176|nr:uncharacterized protein LOC122505874 [Leptopilina heterotoma]
MINKLTLHLLGTVLLIILAIFNYYEDDEKIEFTKYSDKNTKSLDDKPHPMDINLKKQLQIITEYFGKRIENNNQCSGIPNVDNSTSAIDLNFTKIITLFHQSSFEYYFFHNGYSIIFSDMPENVTQEILKLTPLKCDPQFKENRETYKKIEDYFKSYLKYFPEQSYNDKYNACYVDSLLNIQTIESQIYSFNFKNSKISRNSLNNEISANLLFLLPCILLEPKIKINTSFKNKLRILKQVNENNFKHKWKANTLPLKNEIFKNQLKIAIDYFENVLKLNDCSETDKVNNLKIRESNFTKIISLISYTAYEIYFLHKGYYINLSKFPETRKEEMLNSMPSECEPKLMENKETFQNLIHFLNVFLNNFPENFDDNKYSKCFLKNILELVLVENKISLFSSRKYNLRRSSLINSIRNGSQKIHHCIKQ